MQYHSTSVSLTTDADISEGLAVVHPEDGRITGHVTVYLKSGSLSIVADDPTVLDQLADALRNAATLLDTAIHPDAA